MNSIFTYFAYFSLLTYYNTLIISNIKTEKHRIFLTSAYFCLLRYNSVYFVYFPKILFLQHYLSRLNATPQHFNPYEVSKVSKVSEVC